MKGWLMRTAALVCTFVFWATGQACSGFAQPGLQRPTEGRETAFRRAATLTRGVNTSCWFGGWSEYSPRHTSTYMTAADFKVMHAMGIQYVRFPFDPAILAQGGLLTADHDEQWKRVDDALDMIEGAGLAIDFVVFPTDEYKKHMATHEGTRQFIVLWQVLAKHFAGRDPDRFFFELLNEPEIRDRSRWMGIESLVVKAIRQIDTRHTILVSGAHYDDLDDLLATKALADPNVIYTFHFYEPKPFTHQGAGWGTPELLYYKHIPYPASPKSLAVILKTIPNDVARYKLYLYGAEGWNRTTIGERLAFAAAWGRERHVPVICSEFGAFRDTVPADSRARYLEDVRRALEKQGIGWAMWDWSGNFGLVTHRDGKVVADAADVRALGLSVVE
ncbi:MAG: cellulase family glycosylhydrolase [Terracidiphilus sp.]|jgi:aryl-phospho-beta-D-glucosidase BglC (GH1 family)